jgi:hypothetical protein
VTVETELPCECSWLKLLASAVATEAAVIASVDDVTEASVSEVKDSVIERVEESDPGRKTL